MKYIIELEKIEGTDLYRAEGFKTLVFDDYGIKKLVPYNEKQLVNDYKQKFIRFMQMRVTAAQDMLDKLVDDLDFISKNE